MSHMIGTEKTCWRLQKITARKDMKLSLIMENKLFLASKIIQQVISCVVKDELVGVSLNQIVISLIMLVEKIEHSTSISISHVRKLTALHM